MSFGDKSNRNVIGLILLEGYSAHDHLCIYSFFFGQSEVKGLVIYSFHSFLNLNLSSVIDLSKERKREDGSPKSQFL